MATPPSAPRARSIDPKRETSRDRPRRAELHGWRKHWQRQQAPSGHRTLVVPFGSRSQRDATDPERGALSRRGELRLRPRYHPSCAAVEPWRAHLLAVACVGATHPILLAGACSGFLRSNARGRVPRSVANPGLPPAPGRCGVHSPYFSPSPRAMRYQDNGYRSRLVTGDLRSAVRTGRPRGERERPSGWNISSIAAPRSRFRLEPNDRGFRSTPKTAWYGYTPGDDSSRKTIVEPWNLRRCRQIGLNNPWNLLLPEIP